MILLYFCDSNIFMEYNTTRGPLVMKEYGRHIQKMVEFLLTIEDRNKRQEQAEILIELMGFLNPQLKNVEDFRHKLWDHLFYMSGFRLDVDSPYPIPTEETYKEKPAPMDYPNHHPEHPHLGKNLELLIDKAVNEVDEEKKSAFVNLIVYYIKLSYANWHKEQMSDEAVLAELETISHGRLGIDSVPRFKYKPTIEKPNSDSGKYSRGRSNTNGKARSNGGSNNKSRMKSNRNNGGGGNAGARKRFH